MTDSSVEAGAVDHSQQRFSRRNLLKSAAVGTAGFLLGKVSENLGNDNEALPEVTVRVPEYSPPSDVARPIVELPETIMPIVRVNGPEFVARLSSDLDLLVRAVEARKSDPDVNPMLDHLYTVNSLGTEFFNPPTLLSALKLFKDNIDKRYVKINLKPIAHPDVTAQASSDFRIENGTIEMTPTNIDLDPVKIDKELYASLTTPDEEVPISNVGLMALSFYEFFNRLNDFATSSDLMNAPGYRLTTKEKFKVDLANYQKALKEKGVRFSNSNNGAQLAMLRSISALSGNPNAKVIGLERHYSWPLEKLFTASLRGDQKALFLLKDHLSIGAAY